MLKPSCKHNIFLTILLIALFLLMSNTSFILSTVTEQQAVTQDTEFIVDTDIGFSCSLQEDIEDGSTVYTSTSTPIYD